MEDIVNKDGSYNHGGCTIFYSPEKVKILLRYKIYTYTYGEDLGLSVTNNIEYRTKSYIINIPTKNTNKGSIQIKYWTNQKVSDLKTYKDIRLLVNLLLANPIFNYHKLYHYYASICFFIIIISS
ncbi:hypothetical protein WA158_004220 [Blastocystis sp. Blastoise]